MRKGVFFLITLSIAQVCFGKNLSFNLNNKSQLQLKVFYLIIDGIEKGNPNFLCQLDASGTKIEKLNLKKGQKVKFIAYDGSGVETLPIVKEFQNLDKDAANTVEFVLPKIEKLDILELNDLIIKVKNDNVLRILLDTAQFTLDQMYPLGSFIFHNVKNNKVLVLQPSFWKNDANQVRKFNYDNYEILDFVNSSNAASLNVSGIPFLKRLGSTFQKSNLLEIYWKVKNSHMEQWQPTTKNVFEIIQDASNKFFVNSCTGEIKNSKLAGGDYKLYFISTLLLVDSMVVSAKKYDKIEVSADVDFQSPNPNTEVVRPFGVQASYAYLKDKVYTNINTPNNTILKVLALDYTPALNEYISASERETLKNSAIANLNTLKATIQGQYATLRQVDNNLLNTQDPEVIMPIIDVTREKTLRSKVIDSLNNDITPQADKDYNNTAEQFNSILKVLKDKITAYKETALSIDRFGQPADYSKYASAIQQLELDKVLVVDKSKGKTQ